MESSKKAVPVLLGDYRFGNVADFMRCPNIWNKTWSEKLGQKFFYVTLPCLKTVMKDISGQCPISIPPENVREPQRKHFKL